MGSVAVSIVLGGYCARPTQPRTARGLLANCVAAGQCMTSRPQTRAVEPWRDEVLGEKRVVRGASMQLDNPVIYHVKIYWCGSRDISE